MNIQEIGMVMNIFDIALFVILIIYLLTGLLFGFWKNLRRCLSFLIPLGFLLIFAGVIAKGVMYQNIPSFIVEGDINLYDYLYDSFFKEMLVNIDINKNTEILKLVESVIFSIVRMGVVIGGIVIIAFIIAPIIRFIAWIITKAIFKKKKKRAFSRLLGMGLGFVRFSVLFIVLFMPIHGAITTFNTLVYDMQRLPEIINSDQEFEKMINLQSTFKDSFVRKLLGFDNIKDDKINQSAKLFGSYFIIHHNGEKTNIIEEYGNIRSLIAIYQKVVSQDKNNYLIDLNNINDTDINNIVIFLENTKIPNILLPAALETAINQQNLSNIDDLNNILNKIDLKLDYKQLINVIKSSLESFKEIEIDLKEPLNILEDSDLPDSAGKVINEVLKLEIVKKLVLPLAIDEIFNQLSKQDINIDDLKNILTTNALIDLLSTDTANIIKYYQSLAIQISNISQNDGKVNDFNDPNFVNVITDGIDLVFGLSMVKNNELPILKVLLAFVEKKAELGDLDTIFNSITDINWENEVNEIKKFIETVCSFIGTDDLAQFNIDFILGKRDGFKEVVKSASSSQLLKVVLISLLENQLGILIDEQQLDILEYLDVNVLKEMSINDFQNEVMKIYDILEILVDMKILNSEEDIDLTNVDLIESLVLNVFSLELIKGNEKNIFEEILKITNIQDQLNAYGIMLNFNDINWDNEPQMLTNIIKNLAKLTDLNNPNFQSFLEDETRMEDLASLFDAMNESQIFNLAVYNILENIVKENGYHIVISEDDKILITNNTWKVEYQTIFSILNNTNNIINQSDYYNLDSQMVIDIMLSASNGVIASKIVGDMLNNILGVNNLNIIPKDEFGNYLYDFTSQDVLRDNATYVGNLIKLNQEINNFDLSSATNVEVEEIVNIINSLENNDLVNNIIKEVIKDNGLDGDLTNINYNEEATIIQDVYDFYSGYENSEDFNLNENPQLLQKVDDALIAKKILELLGIL